ncbi:O-acetyl-ADP-ribose deacetylase (regulator of RNase III), contains Macro domain [Myxococcus fulvus]|uniref:Appr-1-p processing protein n=1 Tax=Myxococcus fulvus TaxID=33 RepID=A0A511TDB0_MYXFU|nr:macro domain-containing protein [Myxococcus fulvus]GEN11382.1 Appr-1-p processing protein [Myxococcus fulvus]SEU39919.1 O-acetyl-ADP-ribose deacetylase (regulator of RNase III), contains Macro domain [Myxococcus fulvus]
MILAEGNLLQADVQALVNTVNTEGVMGKGIALQFKRAFPAMFKDYEREAKAGRIETGRVHVFDVGSLMGPRWIINFPTKQGWRQPSRLEWIRTGLDSLIEEIQRRGIQSIAVPPLGCGNGGLDWSEVFPLIKESFGRVPAVRVLVYPPRGAPDPETMPVRTARPSLTEGRAGLLGLMRRYIDAGLDEESVSLLEIQKLLYLLQEAGQPLRLSFIAHRYGPYADNLRHVLNKLEGHYLRGFGDGSVSPEKQLRLLPGASDEAQAIIQEHPEIQERFERVARLISGFETPFGMELLSTVHWVATRAATRAKSAAEAIRDVQAWNTRKASLMSPAHVQAAWERLEQQGWLNRA